MNSSLIEETGSIVKHQLLLRGLICTLVSAILLYTTHLVVDHWAQPSYQQLFKELVNAGLQSHPKTTPHAPLNQFFEIVIKFLQLSGYVYVYYQAQSLWNEGGRLKKIGMTLGFLVLFQASDLLLNPIVDFSVNSKIGSHYAASFVFYKYLGLWLSTVVLAISIVLFAPGHAAKSQSKRA